MTANSTNLDKQLQVHILEVWSALVVQTSVCLIGAVLNVLNMIIFHKLNQEATPYLCMAALAFADAGTLLVHLPYGLARCEKRIQICSTDTARQIRSALSYYITYVGFGLGNIFEAISAWITVLICMERYLTTKWPHLAKLRFSRPQVMLQIIIAMTVAVIFHIPMFFTLKIVDKENVTPDNITHHYHQTILTIYGRSIHYYIYTWVRFSIVQCIPLAILCVVNVLLLILVWSSYAKQQRYANKVSGADRQQNDALLEKMKKYRLDVEQENVAVGKTTHTEYQGTSMLSAETTAGELQRSRSSILSSVNEGLDNTKSSKGGGRLDRQQHANNKLTFLLVAVIFLFLIGQIPQAFSYTHIICHIVQKICLRYPAYVNLYRHLSHLTCLITSTANFFLYVTLNRRFRECFCMLFRL